MSLPALATDYLFVGPRIEAQLRAQLVNVPVEGIELMAQVVDAQDMRPRTLYVMWGGDRFDGSQAGRAGNGASTRVAQRWIVWLRLRNASTVEKDARNSDAGPLLSQVHKALAGWTPGGAARPLLRTQGPAPDYRKDSGLYPLAFEINLNL